MNININYDLLLLLYGVLNVKVSLVKNELMFSKRIKMPKTPILSKKEILIEETKEEIKETKKEECNDKIIALTFDDGPSKYTDEILNILKENDSRATFFISGNNIIGNEEKIKKIDAYSNQIGIHGYSHIPFVDMEIEDVSIEIATTHSMLYDIGVNATNLVRPPFGKINKSVKEEVHYPFILWNIDTEDWKYQDKEYIKNTIIDNIESGSIVVLHDRYKQTVEAIKEVIPLLKKQGYKFLTIDEMHKAYNISLVPGMVYKKAN